MKDALLGIALFFGLLVGWVAVLRWWWSKWHHNEEFRL